MQSKYTPNTENLLHRKFNRLTAIGYAGKEKRKNARGFVHKWLWKCDCGQLAVIRNADVKSGNNVSCGCKRHHEIGDRTRKHGMSHTKEHDTWEHMRQRCYNPNERRYSEWGGRGIVMCQGFHEFVYFLSVVGNAPTAKHSIDRQDNNGNYSCGKCAECVRNKWPLNVRWATQTEQVRNREVTPMLTWNGVTLSMGDWADQLNVSYSALNSRVLRGWDTTRIFTQPYRAARK